MLRPGPAGAAWPPATGGAGAGWPGAGACGCWANTTVHTPATASAGIESRRRVRIGGMYFRRTAGSHGNCSTWLPAQPEAASVHSRQPSLRLSGTVCLLLPQRDGRLDARRAPGGAQCRQTDDDDQDDDRDGERPWIGRADSNSIVRRNCDSTSAPSRPTAMPTRRETCALSENQCSGCDRRSRRARCARRSRAVRCRTA